MGNSSGGFARRWLARRMPAGDAGAAAQPAAPAVLGWEPWSLPACLSFRLSVCLCAHRLEAAAQGTWGPEALDLGTPTLTVPRDSHPGTWGGGRLPWFFLPAPSLHGVGEGLQEGLTGPGRWSWGLSSLDAPEHGPAPEDLASPPSLPLTSCGAADRTPRRPGLQLL